MSACSISEGQLRRALLKRRGLDSDYGDVVCLAVGLCGLSNSSGG